MFGLPNDIVTQIWQRFDSLPVWARLVVFLFLAFLIYRGLRETFLGPLRRALFQFRLTLVRFGRWLRSLTKKPAPEPEKRDFRQVPEERTIWETHAPANPIQPLPTSIPIITVANMKGGVGKTTIAANLAVALRDTMPNPGKVLVIDFDYQGSLSQCMRGEMGLTDPDITADYLLGNGGQDPLPVARELMGSLQSISLYPTTYPFATIENRLLAEWLANPQHDLMYRLCQQLRRPEFQSQFKAVVIDCPPRLTAGSINALCASTHLLVPTTLDDMSAQAAQYFLDQISRMKGAVFPGLRVLGIVPTIVRQQGNFLEEESDAIDRLKEYGQSVWSRNDLVMEHAILFRRASISKYAGKGVAYTHTAQAAELFRALATEVQSRF